MADETLLALFGIGVPPYSARGLTQTLEPIGQASNVARTVNGDLIDLSVSSFRKYKSTITGSDQQPPACDGLWPGKQVVVDCIPELAYPVGGIAQRPDVSGSSREESNFVFYRPQLVMVVIAFSTSKDEYGAVTGWTMNLEER
jgi:hypothetical protein